MGIKELSNGRTDVYKLAPSDLHIKEGWNTRDISTPENVEHIENLARSIAQVGVKEPIKVVWESEKAYITNGHCRYHAIQLAIKNGAEIKSVPVMVEDRFGNEADRIFTQIVSNSGKPFTQLEQAKTFKKLLDLGWSQKDIADKSGMTAGRVSQILELLTLPEAVKTMVANGQVSPSMAMQTVKDKGEAEATKTLNTAVENAKKEGKTRAMPKHTGAGSAPNLKTVLKRMITDAYASAKVDEEDKFVTVTFSEDEWADILQRIDY